MTFPPQDHTGCGSNSTIVCEEDKLANEQVLIDAYRLNDGTKVWIMTEADRSSTSILLPSEY